MNWNIKLHSSFLMIALLLNSMMKVSTMQECLNEGGLKLVGTGLPDMGRVEVCFEGSFGTICDNGWDNVDAAVVCSQLGQPFTGATAFTFGGGTASQPIHFDQVNCIGGEPSLISCARGANVSSQCTHRNDVGVACSAFTNRLSLPVICPDNLSCPGESMPFQCISEVDLCNGLSNCFNNLDENSSSLICESREFQCNVLTERVPFDALCNGSAECSGGEDERSEFCSDHCLPPYEGGCQQLNRVCISLRSGPVCGECIDDMVDDSNNPGGACVPFAVRLIDNTPFINITTVTILFTANLPIDAVECLVGDIAVPCQLDNQNIGTLVFDLPNTTSCQLLINITATSTSGAASSPSMVSPFTGMQVGSLHQQFTTPRSSGLTQNQDEADEILLLLYELLFFIIQELGGACSALVVNQVVARHDVLQIDYRLVNTLELIDNPELVFSFNCIKDDDNFSPDEQSCGDPITIDEIGSYSCYFGAGAHTLRIELDPPLNSTCAFSTIEDIVLPIKIPEN